MHPMADLLHTGKVKHGVAIFVHRLPVSSLAHKIQNNGQLEKKKDSKSFNGIITEIDLNFEGEGEGGLPL